MFSLVFFSQFLGISDGLVLFPNINISITQHFKKDKIEVDVPANQLNYKGVNLRWNEVIKLFCFNKEIGTNLYI